MIASCVLGNAKRRRRFEATGVALEQRSKHFAIIWPKLVHCFRSPLRHNKGRSAARAGQTAIGFDCPFIDMERRVKLLIEV